MNDINSNIKQPITPCLKFTKKQLRHRNYIYDAIKSNYLNFVLSKCFCEQKSYKEIIIANYDAWGLNIPTIICDNCCSIRSKYFLDNLSIKKFYTEGYYYPHMFTATSAQNIGMEFNEYYSAEVLKGYDIIKFIKNNLDISKIEKVLEVGCGAGGILEHFQKENKKIYGCDWSKDLINFAKKKLPNGIFKIGGVNKFYKKKFDLIILSDVIEHLIEPNLLLSEIRKYLNQAKFVYINVPGFFGIGLKRWNCNIRQYFKIEHTFCHTLYSLNLLMKKNNFKLIYGNEYVRAIYQKKKKNNYTLDKKMIYKIKKFIFITKIKFYLFEFTKLYKILFWLKNKIKYI